MFISPPLSLSLLLCLGVFVFFWFVFLVFCFRSSCVCLFIVSLGFFVSDLVQTDLTSKSKGSCQTLRRFMSFSVCPFVVRSRYLATGWLSPLAVLQ